MRAAERPGEGFAFARYVHAVMACGGGWSCYVCRSQWETLQLRFSRSSDARR